ncbi:phenylalanine--tRNA ligase subunit beta [bacterium E08(2017)]|nr:phenylalanine--tRNA ligase subunit beta [bacterium E08(2017)]
MKVPLSWLKEYVDVDATAEEIGEKLTFSGMEVESIKTVGSDYEGFVVGEVLEIGQHPDADRLKLCKVNNGSEVLSIVCGATNYEVGNKVPLAGVGCKLPDGTKIKKAKIRGAVSFGMMCSEAELGLSEDHVGIMILDSALEPGTPFAEVMGPPETVIDLEITWNRADCQSIIGVAREVAALYGKDLKIPEIKFDETDEPVEAAAEVSLADSTDCPRYTARVMSDIEVKASPTWMQQRLQLCGIRPINNIVDVTNYVLLECGQPLHAFDYEKLVSDGKARIVVRKATDGEKMVTLDGVERKLKADDLVIADAEKPVALAGVMGGEGSEISESTTKLLLESAYFRPPAVRKASCRLSISSESSYRFERGVDIGNVDWASRRAAMLMAELSGGSVMKGIVDECPDGVHQHKVSLRFQRARDLIGVDISDDEMVSILKSLGLSVVEQNAEACDVEVPTFRHDLDIEADIIEEVARMHGLDALPVNVPSAVVVPDADDSATKAVEACREAMTALGCSEIMNYSFLSVGLLDIFGEDDDDRVMLPNPVSEDYSVLRNSLIPHMGQALGSNLAHQVENTRLFEIGRVFMKTKYGDIAEAERLCVGLMGNVGASGMLGGQAAPSDEDIFLWAKGIIEQLCSVLKSGELTFSDCSAGMYEEGCAVTVEIDGEACGAMGLLSKKIRGEWRMTGPVAVAEMSVEQLVKNVFSKPVLEPVPSYPSITRDMALLVPQGVTHEQVMEVVEKSAPPELTDVSLFDIYTGKGIGDGKRSLAYSLVYRSLKRTLTDEDANSYHEKIKSALKKKLNVEIR